MVKRSLPTTTLLHRARHRQPRRVDPSHRRRQPEHGRDKCGRGKNATPDTKSCPRGTFEVNVRLPDGPGGKVRVFSSTRNTATATGGPGDTYDGLGEPLTGSRKAKELDGWVVKNRRRVETATERKAREAAERVERERAAEERPTVRKYYPSWVATLVVNGTRETTRIAYDSHFEHYILPAFGDVPLAELRAPAIREWLRALRSTPGQRGRMLTASTIRRMFAGLRAMLECAVDDELIESNPAARVKIATVIGRDAPTEHTGLDRRAGTTVPRGHRR